VLLHPWIVWELAGVPNLGEIPVCLIDLIKGSARLKSKHPIVTVEIRHLGVPWDFPDNPMQFA
jgi:hypothetical protein